MFGQLFVVADETLATAPTFMVQAFSRVLNCWASSRVSVAADVHFTSELSEVSKDVWGLISAFLNDAFSFWKLMVLMLASKPS